MFVSLHVYVLYTYVRTYMHMRTYAYIHTYILCTCVHTYICSVHMLTMSGITHAELDVLFVVP